MSKLAIAARIRPMPGRFGVNRCRCFGPTAANGQRGPHHLRTAPSGRTVDQHRDKLVLEQSQGSHIGKWMGQRLPGPGSKIVAGTDAVDNRRGAKTAPVGQSQHDAHLCRNAVKFVPAGA